ncbi:MAG TPA: sulfurtransferase complex subunit TusB [Dissulfurispiraceae bacterium]|nr:sulfurtransferase complex subunit TusB [Dissulfurispiraceae bacterium]
MKLGVFLSEFRTGTETVERFSAEKLGVFLVANGVYHAAAKENGKVSALLDKPLNFYVLSEDLESRGFSSSQVDSRVKVITYGDLVDVMFNDYEKFMWVL